MIKYDPSFREKICELASLIAIKYGGKGNHCDRYTQEHIVEFWKHGYPYPTLNSIRRGFKTNEIKWFIHNRIKIINEEIWNPDFVMGLTSHGTLKWNIKNYPSFTWDKNEDIRKILADCPYGGTVGKMTWINVPALYLRYSEDSSSYIAGIMAGGSIVEEEGFQYAQFNEKTFGAIRRLGIPIERTMTLSKNKFYLISPIWPALFSIKMPKVAGDKWTELKSAYGVDQYAPILWRVYVDGYYKKGGIPYLKSKRTVYYQNESDEGATRRIERMRVEKGMTEIDGRVKEIVRLWSKKVV